jgi:hypothetical protein
MPALQPEPEDSNLNMKFRLTRLAAGKGNSVLVGRSVANHSRTSTAAVRCFGAAEGPGPGATAGDNGVSDARNVEVAEQLDDCPAK